MLTPFTFIARCRIHFSKNVRLLQFISIYQKNGYLYISFPLKNCRVCRVRLCRLGQNEQCWLLGNSRPRTDKSTFTMSRMIVLAVITREKLWIKIVTNFVQMFHRTHFTPNLSTLSYYTLVVAGFSILKVVQTYRFGAWLIKILLFAMPYSGI